MFCLLLKLIATLTVDLAAIVMTLIMIYHIKSKYTAVGNQVMWV